MGLKAILRKLGLAPTPMNIDQKISRARDMGKEAFHRGASDVPALDMKNLAPLFHDLAWGESVLLIGAWNIGWATASHAMAVAA